MGPQIQNAPCVQLPKNYIKHNQNSHNIDVENSHIIFHNN